VGSVMFATMFNRGRGRQNRGAAAGYTRVLAVSRFRYIMWASNRKRKENAMNDIKYERRGLADDEATERNRHGHFHMNIKLRCNYILKK
jgi:hypothetical protein